MKKNGYPTRTLPSFYLIIKGLFDRVSNPDRKIILGGNFQSFP